MATNTKNKKRPKSSPSHHTLDPAKLFLNFLPSSKAEFIRLLAVVAIAAVVAVACNFIAGCLNQPPKPFCDTTTYDPDNSLSDDCESCPENGICHDGKLECGRGYRKHGRLCVEDGDIIEAAKELSKWVEVRVCEDYAQLLCSGTGKCWVSEDEILNHLDEYKTQDNHGLEEAIYTPAKQRAVKTIHSLLETRRDHRGVEEFKCPELLVTHYKPLFCVVRQWIIKNALVLVAACALGPGYIEDINCLSELNGFTIRTDGGPLNEDTFPIQYQENGPGILRSISGEGEPWVAASWLRDHLLKPKERKDRFLWRKVEELVQEDSRIDQYPKLVKGESKVVWEWQVEGSLGSSGKRKKSDGSTAELKKTVNSTSNSESRMHGGFAEYKSSYYPQVSVAYSSSKTLDRANEGRGLAVGHVRSVMHH